jgi:hypothetical protein
METISIKLLDNPENPKLKMKYVGSVEYVTPKVGPDGKIKTGLDENALEILAISDSKEREAKQKKIKKEREELERLLGVELNPHSSYWDKFFIALNDEEKTLDPSNPLDRVIEKFLVANEYVAPSLEAINEDDRYINCIFYLYRKEEETTKKAEKQKFYDKAKAKLSILEEENPNKLKIVASYLFGFNAQTDISVETAYTKIADFLEVPVEAQRKKNVKMFMDAVEKTPEQLKTKLILDKAVKKRIVSSRGGIYRRGDLVLGNSYEEALDNLSSVEMNSELASLIKETDKA